MHHELLLTTRQRSKLRNGTLSKAQLSRRTQSGRILGALLSKIAGQLMKVAVLLANNVLAPLGVTAAALIIDAGIQEKFMVVV